MTYSIFTAVCIAFSKKKKKKEEVFKLRLPGLLTKIVKTMVILLNMRTLNIIHIHLLKRK